MRVTWSDLAADALSASQLYEVLTLRARVFVVEQDCPYLDLDGLDLVRGTRHLLGLEGGELVAYSRLLAPDGHGRARIGRVVVTPSARGRELGRALMGRALACCGQHWPGSPVAIAAQARLTAFYASLGFTPTGPEHDEDGIAHVDMLRTASRGA